MTDLDRIVGDARAQIVDVLRAAAVRAGGLVAEFEVSFDEAADRIEQLADELGIEITDAVLAGLDAGMDGAEATEAVSERPERQNTHSAPVSDAEAVRAPFRDADECADALVAWASARLVADLAGRVTSAELAADWMRADGRRLVGFGSLTEAVNEWARAQGHVTAPYRTDRHRGVRGLRLTPPDTPSDRDGNAAGPLTTESGEHPELTPAAAPGPAAPADGVVRPDYSTVQARPPDGGWQRPGDLDGAASADASGWFEV